MPFKDLIAILPRTFHRFRIAEPLRSQKARSRLKPGASEELPSVSRLSVTAPGITIPPPALCFPSLALLVPTATL